MEKAVPVMPTRDKGGAEITPTPTARAIVSSRLTNCNVIKNGEAIRLNFVEQMGDPVSVELPFEQAASFILTLPRLLSTALKAQTGSNEMRYVFPLAHWLVERSGDQKTVMLTLRTPDGFEACFGVPLEACRRLGSALGDAPEAVIKYDAAMPNMH
jgi:hypothetical protein